MRSFVTSHLIIDTDSAVEIYDSEGTAAKVAVQMLADGETVVVSSAPSAHAVLRAAGLTRAQAARRLKFAMTGVLDAEPS